MSFLSWLGRSVRNIRSDGVVGLRRSADDLKHGVARRIDPYISGTQIFAREWDILIVLDACRPDVLAEVAEEYDFLPSEVETVWSTSSNSWLWMERNFTSEWSMEMAETTHITGNPYSNNHLDSANFESLDEVWRYAWDETRGTIPPRPITDRAITTAREAGPRRLLIHYMQPHFPSIPDPIGSSIDLDTFGDNWDSVWEDLESGRISADEVWQSYRANLKHVLDDVDLLLRNVDAEQVVITADHGNAFGELGFYGHPPFNPTPSLRRVPWIEATATDYGEYEPTQEYDSADIEKRDVEARLKDLGYR